MTPTEKCMIGFAVIAFFVVACGIWGELACIKAWLASIDDTLRKRR
jgi:hypothetical protein